MSQRNDLPDIGELLNPFVARIAPEDLPRAMALLERGAGARYRVWAERDDARKEELLACADREEEIAARVESLFVSGGPPGEGFAAVLAEAGRAYAEAIEGREPLDQFAIQAAAERRGAGVWRGLAAQQEDAALRDALEQCAQLEERNAGYLESECRRAGEGRG